MSRLRISFLVFLIGWSHAVQAGAPIEFFDARTGKMTPAFFLDTDLPVPWLFNVNGMPGVTDGSDLVAVRNGFARWEEVLTNYIRFRFDGFTGHDAEGRDGRNVITFNYPPILIAGAVAATLVDVLEQDTTFETDQDFNGDGLIDLPAGTYPAGTIVDVDLAFNPNPLYSRIATDGSEDAIDVEGTAVHEIGHFHGLMHSPIGDLFQSDLNATMFPVTLAGQFSIRTLEDDDRAATSQHYPNRRFYIELGCVSGHVVDGLEGNPVPGAHVVAVNASTGNYVVGAYTDTEGRYRIQGLPPGQYQIYVHPLTDFGADAQTIGGPVIPLIAVTDFDPEFYDDAESANEPDPNRAATTGVNAATNVDGIDIILNNGTTVPVFLRTTQLASTDDSIGPYTVTTTIVDDGTIVNAELIYSVNGGTALHIPLLPTSGSNFRAEIPGQPLGSRITYYLSATDDSNNTRTDPADVPAAPYAFQIITRSNEPLVFVAVHDSKELVIVDSGVNSVIHRVALADNPVQVLAHPDGERVIVVGANGRIQIVSANGIILKSLNIGGGLDPSSRAAVMTPDGSTLYVANGNGVISIDLKTYATGALNTAVLPLCLAISDDGRYLGMAGVDIQNIFSLYAIVQDLLTNDVVAAVSINSIPTVCAFKPGEPTMVFGDLLGDSIGIIHFDSGDVIQAVVRPSPADLLFLDAERLVTAHLSAFSHSTFIQLLETQNYTLKADINTGVSSPNGLAFDANRNLLFVPGMESDQMAVVDMSSYLVVQKITVGSSPTSAAVLIKNVTDDDGGGPIVVPLLTQRENKTILGNSINQTVAVSILEPDLSSPIKASHVTFMASVPGAATAVVEGKAYPVSSRHITAFSLAVHDGPNEIHLELLDISGVSLGTETISFEGDPPPQLNLVAPNSNEVFDTLTTTLIVEINTDDIQQLTLNSIPLMPARTVQVPLQLTSGRNELNLIATDGTGQTTQIERTIFAGTDFFWSPLGEQLPAFDDRFIEIPWPTGDGITVFGQTYHTLTVSPDGIIGFGSVPTENPDNDNALIDRPTFSVFGIDLNPAYARRFGDGSGGLYLNRGPGQLLLTWNRVPLYKERQCVTAQVALWEDGTIQVAYAEVDTSALMIALNPGGIPVESLKPLMLSSLQTPVEAGDGFQQIFTSDAAFDLEGKSILIEPDDESGYTVRLGTRPFTSVSSWWLHRVPTD